MSFVTPAFWIFFSGTFLIYFLLRREHRWQNFLLLVASYVFYAWWDWRFISLLLISSATDYFCGLAIERQVEAKFKKIFLILGLSINLGILLFFKSYDFFVANLNHLLSCFGLEAHSLHLHVILPLGISFYTFQTMGYLIDVYRGSIRPIRGLLDYLLFVSFFPQLIAGPIERAKDLSRQIGSQRTFSWSNLRSGTYLIYWGLFKKLFVADHCAVLARKLFMDPLGASGAEVLVSLYAFAFQIYCDIAGYTDIARGTARLMGFDLTINFRWPYFSRDISDFWRRWHMSMTYWFRDYVFFPVLAYSKGNASLASFVTLLCISLWHSISFSSVLRGVYFGLAVVAFHFLKRYGASLGPARGWMRGVTGVTSWFVTFHVVCVGWMFFYPIGVRTALTALGKVFWDLRWSEFLTHFRMLVLYVFVLLGVEAWQAIRGDEFVLLKTDPVVKMVFYWGTFWLLCGAGGSENFAFIYFGI